MAIESIAMEPGASESSQAATRAKWSLTQQAFDGLLSSLGPDRDLAGGRYLEIRRNLVRLFEWRGCATPDEYADETINRCARKIAEGDEIQDPATYCIGIARMLLKEMARDRAMLARPLESIPEPSSAPVEPADHSDRRPECLRGCMDRLAPHSRDLILNYYQGDKGEKIRNRQTLMQRLGVPAGALRMRALRVRESLQLCVENCLGRQGERVM